MGQQIDVPTSILLGRKVIEGGLAHICRLMPSWKHERDHNARLPMPIDRISRIAPEAQQPGPCAGSLVDQRSPDILFAVAEAFARFHSTGRQTRDRISQEHRMIDAYVASMTVEVELAAGAERADTEIVTDRPKVAAATRKNPPLLLRRGSFSRRVAAANLDPIDRAHVVDDIRKHFTLNI